MEKRRALMIAALLGALLAGFFWYVWQLAAGTRPGLREETQADVKMYYPAGKDDGFTVFVAPPPPLLRPGKEIPLSILFRNGMPATISVSQVRISPANCFKIRRDPVREPAGIRMEGQQSKAEVQLLMWDGTNECNERQSFVLFFDWQVVSAVKGKPTSGSYAVASSQLRLLRQDRTIWERIFHVFGLLAGAILTPFVIALVTIRYQQYSAKREARQKVWEIVYPDIVSNIQTHYAPILRRLGAVSDSLGALSNVPTTAECHELAEKILLLRAEVRRFAALRGGFLFRSKAGEELCGDVVNAFWQMMLKIDSPQIQHLVAQCFLNENVLEQLPAAATGSAEFVNYRDELVAKLSSVANSQTCGDVKNLLRLAITILQCESDHPLYPEWYDSKPSFDLNIFREFLLSENSPSYLLKRISVGDERRTRRYAKQYLKETKAWADSD